MDLANLISLKQINPQGDEEYAYTAFEPGQLFKLQWKEGETNADKADRDELTLLKQRGYITHLVRIADDRLTRDSDDDWGVYRIAEVIWTIDFNNPSEKLLASNVFESDFEGVQGGNLMRFATMHKTFQKKWPGDTGLATFHERVNELLQLK